MTREWRIINWLMGLCLVFGFACFVLIALPHQLDRARIPGPPVIKPPDTPQFSAIIGTEDKQSETQPQLENGTVAQFIPEPEPAMKLGQNQSPAEPDQLQTAYNDSSNPVEGEDSPESLSDLRLTCSPPEKVIHPVSSLAQRATSQLDAPKALKTKSWIFPPEGLEKDVDFWRDIYTKYDKNQVVLHHPKYLDIVYEVIDLSDIDSDPRLSDIEREHMKEKRVEARRDYTTDVLRKLAEYPQGNSLTDEELFIKKLFTSHMEESDTFKKAADLYGVRAQTGQKDKFVTGIKESGKYLGEIETIFDSYGLPRELTRLIFVESMFNTSAKSSVGASGIWQFMKGTGKLYLQINRLVDERSDPILETHAAAKLLRRNYNELGSWPLAINAYNTGWGRMAQAVQRTGSTDIEKIIREFDHPSYGFASRNFYLEYLAALDVAEHWEKYFGKIQQEDPLRYEIVRPICHISLPDVAKLSGISIEDLEKLNPAFSNAVLSGRELLPTGFAIRVPEGRGELFSALAQKALKSRSGPVKHVVDAGETLAEIAKMYGVTEQDLRQSNRGISRQPSRGQIVVIPK